MTRTRLSANFWLASCVICSRSESGWPSMASASILYLRVLSRPIRISSIRGMGASRDLCRSRCDENEEAVRIESELARPNPPQKGICMLASIEVSGRSRCSTLSHSQRLVRSRER